MKRGSLYVCATPIGNLSDSSFRLIDVLNHVSLIAAEDTRKTNRILRHFNIKTPLLSLEKYNEGRRVRTLQSLLDQEKDIALVSEAGTPNVSDPGAHVIHLLSETGYPVIPLPGPSAITALISVSGILANRFLFLGFLPKKLKEALTFFEASISLELPLFFFESAKRLVKTLEWLRVTFSVSHIAVGKELTKKFEKIYTQPVSEILEKLKQESLKGEWAVFVKLEYSSKEDIAKDIKRRADELKKAGLTNAQILFVMTRQLGFSKNKVYPYLFSTKE